MENHKRRLLVSLTDESWGVIENLTKESNNGFETGNITYSDLINEIILSSKIDIKELQKKHTNWRRTLKVLASKEDLDIETAIKILQELKPKQKKKISEEIEA